MAAKPSISLQTGLLMSGSAVKKLVSELREKRQSDPNAHYLIREGEIGKQE